MRQLGRSVPSSPPPGLLSREAEHRLTKLGQRVPNAPWSRQRKAGWAGATLALAVILVAGAIAGYGYYLNHQIGRVNVGALTKSTSGAENVLLVGSTDRCALKVQNPAYGLCQNGVNGVNSDVIMIVHLVPKTKSVSLLSIPRDLLVANARREGPDKVDGGLAEGPNQLVDSIQENFGIPINHYIELNFDTFSGVVDAFGGINMFFPEPIYDGLSGLNVTQTGCQHLNGVQALQVVRARHLQYKGPGVTSNDPKSWPQEGQSDLARIQRDHEFLEVLASKVEKKGLSNPVTDSRMISSIAPDLQVDSSFSGSALANLMLTFRHVNAASAPQLTLPVLTSTLNSYYAGGENLGNIEFPDQPLDQQVVDQFLGEGPNANTMTGGKLPSPGSVTVSVKNGTSAGGRAGETASALTGLGFNASPGGNAKSPTQQPSETFVYYGAVNGRDMGAAQAVARDISGSVMLAYNPAMVAPGSQVTVVTGSSFSVTPPPPPAPPAPPPPKSSSGGSVKSPPPGASGSSSSTAAAPSQGSGSTPPPPVPPAPPGPGSASSAISSGQFAPPSASNPTLPPEDPRSCTPSGGEGP